MAVDLTVVVVVERDETQEIHDLGHRGLTSNQLEEYLGVQLADDHAALLAGTLFVHAYPDLPRTMRRELRRMRRLVHSARVRQN